MPLNESLLQKFGGLTLPAQANTDDGTLTSLDPGRDKLLALFASAIRSELGDAWASVLQSLPQNHPYQDTQVVQDTLPDEPSQQSLTQRKSGFPLLCLHRVGSGTYDSITFEIMRLTQPWKLIYILGPLDVIDQRKLKDVCVAVAKVVALVVRQRGHRSYESGALQFAGDAGNFTSVRIVSHEGPGQAVYVGGNESTLYWAIEINLETTERSDDIDGAIGEMDAADFLFGVGDEDEILPELILAQTDAQTPDE